MTYKGTFRGGVIVLEPGVQLSEGAEVCVVPIQPANHSASAEPTTIGEKLAELGRRVEREPCDLPEDLAANHDHYIHGLPKCP